MTELRDLLADLRRRLLITSATIDILPITESAVASISANGTPVDLRGNPVRQLHAVDLFLPMGGAVVLSAYSFDDLTAKVRAWAQEQTR